MRFRSQLIFLLFFLPVLCQAQDVNGKILLTVAGRNTEAGEFIRMYKKSMVPGKPSDIDSYLQQFILFKLKVADAIKARLDTSGAFKNELKGYRNQLAQNHLTDQLTKQKLLKQAYDRYMTEVNAWHILVSCPANTSPEDTLIAWNKANDIKERIVMGESFEHVARGTSDDKSVMVNGGNLGYFTAFQMIMPFEDAAYKLRKGQISDPVRTPYGYHIIKVTDKRPSKGKILVAHIMKAVQPGASEKESEDALSAINTIYSELQKGNSFSETAKKFSDHKESAVLGGQLNWFGPGEMMSDFSEAAFGLKDTGNYTKPVRSLYGWHIIKLLDKKAPGSFEEAKSFLESKLNQSNLNSLAKKSLVEKLKKEYKLKINSAAYQWFIDNTDTLIIQGLKKYPRDLFPTGNMYSFANQRFTTREFASFIEKRGSMIVTDDPVLFVDNSLNTRVADHIIIYENSILEKKYPDFRYLMNEFHDGILLFEISEKKIWKRVSSDSIGLLKYYEEHKKEFLSPKKAEAKIYNLNQPGLEQKFIKAYRKYTRKPYADKKLLNKFNKDGTVVSIEEGSWFEGENTTLDKIEWTPGTILNQSGNLPPVIVIKNVLEPVPLPFDEVRVQMMTGFQEELEASWIKQLRELYPVKVDNSILEAIKKKLKNE